MSLGGTEGWYFSVSTPRLMIVTLGRQGELLRTWVGTPQHLKKRRPWEQQGWRLLGYCNWHPQLHDQLSKYLQGKPVRFVPIKLMCNRWTPFRRRVIEACRRIPHGQTLTYGQLAQQVGNPGAARAVGAVMRWNPWPVVVPCHRVLGAQGQLVGYSSPQGITIKRLLLLLEGISQVPGG